MTRTVAAGAILGMTLGISGVAGAASLAELGAATAVHDAAAGAAMGSGSTARSARDTVQRNLPKGSTCPINLLGDYGKRVAAEQVIKTQKSSAWATGGSGPGRDGKGWVTATSGSARSAGRTPGGWASPETSRPSRTPSGWATADGRGAGGRVTKTAARPRSRPR
jgi:hypothetical protein